METVDRLWAIEQIKQLKARYFRFLDTKDWEGMRTIWTDDAVFDARTAKTIDASGAGTDAAEWVWTGCDAIVSAISAVANLPTAHHGHCHEIEVLSATDARGRDRDGRLRLAGARRHPAYAAARSRSLPRRVSVREWPLADPPLAYLAAQRHGHRSLKSAESSRVTKRCPLGEPVVSGARGCSGAIADDRSSGDRALPTATSTNTRRAFRSRTSCSVCR
jgi:hypothetical protein